jgi:anti-anti-sigma factor
MESRLNVSERRGTLELEGELTIEVAEELKAILLQALQGTESLTIDLERVTAADLSCLQLLCSAYRSCGRVDGQLILRAHDSELFNQLLKDSGYCKTAKCPVAPARNCMWTGGIA